MKKRVSLTTTAGAASRTLWSTSAASKLSSSSFAISSTRVPITTSSSVIHSATARRCLSLATSKINYHAKGEDQEQTSTKYELICRSPSKVFKRLFHSTTKERVDYLLPHPIWKGEYVDAVQVTHKEPKTLLEKLAYYSVRIMRFNFDWMSGYMFGEMTEGKWLSRVMYLETVAGVPGSLAAMLRHLHSLRRVERDHGWIHTLLEEAENERMHLLVALALKKPTKLFRAAIWITQGVFTNFFFLAYLVSPTFCHSFVGYLEEEAVKTYSKMLHDMDHGCLAHWNTTPAPDIAKAYWKLPADATMREVVAMIRSDEAHHRDVNQTFSAMKTYQDNPFNPGE